MLLREDTSFFVNIIRLGGFLDSCYHAATKSDILPEITFSWRCMQIRLLRCACIFWIWFTRLGWRAQMKSPGRSVVYM
ncbi:unnamed protein product [Citrullus colocynthis]|uniref:Uncharacterized protein n=1 Tax=Citrullus colocynthis TaxID=252529 RepID=A0ABP0ZAQ8_9ROSI